jgi:hypothetical protein
MCIRPAYNLMPRTGLVYSLAVQTGCGNIYHELRLRAKIEYEKVEVHVFNITSYMRLFPCLFEYIQPGHQPGRR